MPGVGLYGVVVSIELCKDVQAHGFQRQPVHHWGAPNQVLVVRFRRTGALAVRHCARLGTESGVQVHGARIQPAL